MIYFMANDLEVSVTNRSQSNSWTIISGDWEKEAPKSDLVTYPGSTKTDTKLLRKLHWLSSSYRELARPHRPPRDPTHLSLCIAS